MQSSAGFTQATGGVIRNVHVALCVCARVRVCVRHKGSLSNMARLVTCTAQLVERLQQCLSEDEEEQTNTPPKANDS